MNDSGTRSDYHLSFDDHHCHHELTRRSLIRCLLRVVLQRTHTHTHAQKMNVTTCIIDLRSQLQQTPAVIKKRLFCFISPLRFPYQLICIINSVWRCPRKPTAAVISAAWNSCRLHSVTATLNAASGALYCRHIQQLMAASCMHLLFGILLLYKSQTHSTMQSPDL